MNTLQSIYEEKKDRLIERISGQERQAVIGEIQTELDRVLFTFYDQEPEETVREAVGGMMQTARNAVGMIDTEGPTKIYGRTEYREKTDIRKRSKPPLRFWLFLLPGLVLAAAAIVTGLSRMGDAGTGRGLMFLLELVLAALLLFGAGASAGTSVPGKKEELHAETSLDPQKVHRQLLAVFLTMDKQVEEIRRAERSRKRQELAQRADSADQEELELMAQLLEDAYARRGNQDGAEELCAQLKYYLHRKEIDVIDYETMGQSSEDRVGGTSVRGWFDMIPAYTSGTIRPALVMNGRLLKKGLASNG